MLWPCDDHDDSTMSLATLWRPWRVNDVSSNRILPFVYTFSGISLNFWRSSKVQDVLVMGIVTYAWWFQEPDHTRMLCLRWSTSISYAAPCCMLHQCVTCWDISTLPGTGYAPLLNFHPGWQRSCVVTSSAGVAIHCSGWLCREVSRSYGARKHSLFKRLSAGTWPCREWAAFVSCFFFSTLAHTSILISGGAIPASRYSSSTLVGLNIRLSIYMRRSVQDPVWKHVGI